MQKREKIIYHYFNLWLNGDEHPLVEIFHESCVYIESYGPVYNNLEQIYRWFRDWNKKGKVLIWEVKEFFHKDSSVICEWYFKYEYEGKTDEFDGVSIIYFDQEDKITYLKEFQSKLPNTYPYD